MRVRDATVDDFSRIRDIAHDSLVASYSGVLDANVIETAVESWYDEGALQSLLDDANVVLKVAEREGQVMGFVQAVVIRDDHPLGRIQWLHVDPEYRGRGIGPDLLDAAESTLRDRGAEWLQGAVLAGNETGVGFYEDQGYQRLTEHEVMVADESFVEYIFARQPAPHESLVTKKTPGNDTVYVAKDESEQGSKSPFYPVYSNMNRENKWGYACGNCESLDVAVN
ncbi:MAG: GNAT family N-acetyltransferase, partial [Halobacteriaceae archaeon]